MLSFICLFSVILLYSYVSDYQHVVHVSCTAERDPKNCT